VWSRRLAPPAARGGARDGVLGLGALWATLGALPIALAGHHYSAYYVTFSGVGFALALGRVLAPTPPALAFALFAASAVAGEAANRVDLFNFERMEPEAGVSFITMGRFEYEVAFLDSLHVAMDRLRPAPGSRVFLSHAPHYTSFVTVRGACARVWFEDPALELGSIGDYRGPESRPHAFLRFDPASHGFVHVPNEVMDADLAAERAMDQHRPADARAAVDRALALLPTSGPEVVRLDLLNNRGFACASLGDTAAARDSWRRALAIDPAFASAALNLARLDAPAGRLADARTTLERLLVHAPANGEALSLLVRVQRVQGDETAAQVTLTKLAEVAPEMASQLE